jgi:ATP-binding protein involved in chromosome partitioning
MIQKIQSHKVQTGLAPLASVKNIIAIASGKGGVGKSTVTSNLALALQAQGARVGVLDADIYGPSQPTLFNVFGKPQVKGGKFLPLESYGIQLMSIGFLIDADKAAIWRGPMVAKALMQMLDDTAWDGLDYLLLDLPPGTGDIQLTMAQKIPVAGAVVVTTPQDLSLIDARRAVAMFNKVNVPVLGIIENMSYYHCQQCDHQEAIFGEAGAQKMCDEFTVSLLGHLPLAKQIREQADHGKPIVIAEPDSNFANIYREIASNVVANLSLQKKDYSAKFGALKIEEQ